MMTRRRGLLVSAIVAGTLMLATSPAQAGDFASPMSPAGNWRTHTHGVKQIITFTKDGKVYGDSGCNRFTGTYKVKGDHLTIGPLASTMMACPEPQMSAEATFLTRLQAAVAYHATSKVLRVYAPKDMIRFVAR
jgi:heat shock protein HslJ